MKRITFFFGSGADTDYCSDMPSGDMFSSALLQNTYNKAITDMLGEKVSSLYLVTYNSRKFFLQTICGYRENAMLIDLFGEDVVKMCRRVYGQDEDASDADKKAIEDYCKEWYYYTVNKFGKVDKPKFREKSEEIREFFLSKGRFFDVLDEKFNSLRFPNKSNKAQRVKNAYAAVFFLMLSKVYRNQVYNDKNKKYYSADR